MSSSPNSNRPRRPRPVTRFRSFRNSDPPALVRLWNQAIPESWAVRPLRVHELDAHALGTVNFEAAGLIVAEQDGRIVGFVHAGFGPDLPVESTQPFQLSHELGTIAMLVVEPNLDDPELVSGLIAAAERYLRARGAKGSVRRRLVSPESVLLGTLRRQRGIGRPVGAPAVPHAHSSSAATNRPARPCFWKPISPFPSREIPALC